MYSCLVYTVMITSLTSGIYKISGPCRMCQIMVECTRQITCCAVARSPLVPLQAKEHGAVSTNFNFKVPRKKVPENQGHEEGLPKLRGKSIFFTKRMKVYILAVNPRL